MTISRKNNYVKILIYYNYRNSFACLSEANSVESGDDNWGLPKRKQK